MNWAFDTLSRMLLGFFVLFSNFIYLFLAVLGLPCLEGFLLLVR